MLVDPEGKFVSQRSCPRMSLISVSAAVDGWRLTASGMEELVLASPIAGAGTHHKVKIWGDEVDAVLGSEEAAQWFSSFLGEPLHVVFFPEESLRPADQRYAPPEAQIAFADGFPFLICSEASLNDLNKRLDSPVSMERFRPNIVLEGGGPFDEDEWDSIEIDGVVFDLRSPCARCSITTVEIATGERGLEPLATLSTYRKTEEGVLFGQNAIHKSLGSIHLGAVARPRH
jgi:hypothetical protein